MKNAASRLGLGSVRTGAEGLRSRPAAPERKRAPTPSLPAAHPACAARRRTGWCDEEVRANVRGSNDKTIWMCRVPAVGTRSNEEMRN